MSTRAQWLAQLTAAWRSTGGLADFRPERDMRVDSEAGTVTMSINATRNINLDLNAVPSDARLTLDITASGSRVEVRLRRLGALEHALIVRQGQGGGFRSLVLSDCAGPVQLQDLGTSQVQVTPGGATLIVGQNADVGLMSPTILYLQDGGAASFTEDLEQVHLNGSGSLNPQAPQLGVEELFVSQDAKLSVAGRGGVRIAKVRSEPDVTLELELQADYQKHRKVAIQDISGPIGIKATKHSYVIGVRTVTQARFVGPISLQVVEGGIGDAVAFESLVGTSESSQCPSLSVGRNAVVTEVSGRLQLGGVSGGHVAGSSDGYTILGQELRSAGVAPNPSELWAESVLTGFELPSGLRGRQMLAELGDAFYVDPLTTNLPGWNQRLFSPAGRDRYRGDQGKKLLHQDAEFMREMERLVGDKGAPGSTRTRVAWCSYRLRELKARGVERAALAAYRTLGFGERPLPALVTWLVLAVLAGATALHWQPDWSLGGARALLRQSWHQAIGPLSGVMKSGSPSANSDWEYAMRAAVAVPLVTAALAVRNYVKGPRR